MKRIRLLLVFVLALLTACADKPGVAPMDLPPLVIGVVPVTQPMGTTDLMAGYLPENRSLASEAALMDFNTALSQKLSVDTRRSYRFLPAVEKPSPSSVEESTRSSALEYWVSVGRANGVDILLIPQILDWQERDGGPAGVRASAGITMDFFLVDARPDGGLLNRSHFSEKQESLNDNLLKLGTFLRRGAKWLSAQELAGEAIDKMITDFAL